VKGKGAAQTQEARDEEELASGKMGAIDQRVKALTDSQSALDKRLKEFSGLLGPYMKETRGEIDSIKQTQETILKALESIRKNTVGGAVPLLQEGVEGEQGTQTDGPLPKSALASIMQSTDMLVKTAHELTNITATYFPKIQTLHQGITDQLTLVHQKLSMIDGRITTVEKILKIKTPTSGNEQTEGPRDLENVDPAIATIIRDAVSETDAELAAKRKATLQDKLRTKLDSAGKTATTSRAE
jgi:hypothetical protein